jgi:hypothetical protein
MTSRKEAKAAGATQYRGERCPHGHTERYTSNNKCVACHRKTAEKYRSEPKATKKQGFNGEGIHPHSVAGL